MSGVFVRRARAGKGDRSRAPSARRARSVNVKSRSSSAPCVDCFATRSCADDLPRDRTAPRKRCDGSSRMYAECVESQWISCPPIPAGHIRLSDGVKCTVIATGGARFDGVADRRRRATSTGATMRSRTVKSTPHITRVAALGVCSTLCVSVRTVDLGRVAVDAKGDPITAEQLQRIRPYLEPGCGVSTHHRAATGNDQVAAVGRIRGGPTELG